MKLAPDHRDVIDEITAKAHADNDLSRDIAAQIVDEIEDLERFGQDWSPPFLRELAIKGASQLAREWRRRQVTTAQTAQGTTVPVPAYAAVRTDEGYTQVRLADMTEGQLKAHRERLSSQRNTLSKEIRYVSDLLDVMAANPKVSTVGEARLLLRERAA